MTTHYNMKLRKWENNCQILQQEKTSPLQAALVGAVTGFVVLGLAGLFIKSAFMVGASGFVLGALTGYLFGDAGEKSFS